MEALKIIGFISWWIGMMFATYMIMRRFCSFEEHETEDEKTTDMIVAVFWPLALITLIISKVLSLFKKGFSLIDQYEEQRKEMNRHRE